MNIKAHIARLALRQRDTLTLEAARGALVRCLEGLVWITQDGDRADHIVGAGGLVPGRSGRRGDRAGDPAGARVAIESPRDDAPEHWWDPLSRGHA